MATRLDKLIFRTIRGLFRQRLLSNFGMGIAVEAKNGTLIVDPRDYSVSRKLLRDGEYAWPKIRWLRKLLDEHSRLVVVGAHIGAMLTPLAKCAGSAIAFEPDARNFRFAQVNATINGLDNTVIHNKAVGDRRQEAHIAHNWVNSGDSRISPDHSHGEAVEMVSLDEFLPPDPIDLMVMDVQGYECFAIQGAEATLSRTRAFFVEYAPWWLEKQGASAERFLAQMSERFPFMYTVDHDVIGYHEPSEWLEYLRGLPVTTRTSEDVLFSREELAWGGTRWQRPIVQDKRDSGSRPAGETIAVHREATPTTRE